MIWGRAQPAPVTIALALMVFSALMPIAFCGHRLTWTRTSGPGDEYTAVVNIGVIFLGLLIVINTIILLGLAGLVWAGFGWSRYAYLVICLTGVPTGTSVLASGGVLASCMFLASAGSVVLLFLPSSHCWFQRV